MGNSPHLQLLQQHSNPHHRHIWGRNYRPHHWWNVCQSRSHGIITLRSNACCNRRSRSRSRQRNHGYPYQSPRSRRIWTQNSGTRCTSSHPSTRQIRFPHRTHRRSNTNPTRWHKKAWRQKRQKSLKLPPPQLFTGKNTNNAPKYRIDRTTIIVTLLECLSK